MHFLFVKQSAVAFVQESTWNFGCLFKEDLYCQNKKANCDCQSICHSDNKSSSFYHFKPDAQHHASKSVDVGGSVQSKERELFHVRVLVSLIRKNKSKIKSTYLNEYNLQATTLPNVLQTLTTLGLFEDVRFQLQPAAENQRFEDEYEFVIEEIRKLEEEVKETPYQPDSLAVIEAKPMPVYYLFYQNFPTAVIQNYLNEYLLTDLCPTLSELTEKKEETGGKAGKVVDLGYREPYYYKMLKQRILEQKKPEPVQKMPDEIFIKVTTKSAKKRSKKYKKQNQIIKENELSDLANQQLISVSPDESKSRVLESMIEGEALNLNRLNNIDLMLEKAKSEQLPRQSLIEALSEKPFVELLLPEPLAKDKNDNFELSFVILPSEVEQKVKFPCVSIPNEYICLKKQLSLLKSQFQDSIKSTPPNPLSRMVTSETLTYSRQDYDDAVKLIREKFDLSDTCLKTLSEETFSDVYAKGTIDEAYHFAKVPASNIQSQEVVSQVPVETLTKKSRKNKRKKGKKANNNEVSEENVNNTVTKGIQTADYSFQQSDYTLESQSAHGDSRVQTARNGHQGKSIASYSEVKEGEKQLKYPNLIEKIQIQLQKGAKPINNVEYNDLCESEIRRTRN